MLTENEYDLLVGLIYDAAAEPLRLKQALAAVVRTVDAAGAHLVGFDKTSMQVRLSAITGFPLLGEVDYNERYAKADPRAPLYLSAPVGKWLSCHEHFDQAFVDSSEFFQDFLIPYGGRYVSAVKLLEDDTYAVILGIHRGIAQQPLDLDALVFLRRLTPHFERSMRLIFQYAELQNQWAVAKATLDMLDYGAFICDEGADVFVANAAALATAEQHDGIAVSNGRIQLSDKRLNARLRELLLGGSERTAGTSAGSDVTGLLIERASGLRPYQLIARRLDPARALLGLSGRTLWSIIVSDPDRASIPTMRAVSLIYGLTPAESKLATMLMAGSTLEEIALRSLVKRSTIKSQLDSLFAKTGTQRQADLVRLFSASPLLRHEAGTV